MRAWRPPSCGEHERTALIALEVRPRDPGRECARAPCCDRPGHVQRPFVLRTPRGWPSRDRPARGTRGPAPTERSRAAARRHPLGSAGDPPGDAGGSGPLVPGGRRVSLGWHRQLGSGLRADRRRRAPPGPTVPLQGRPHDRAARAARSLGRPGPPVRRDRHPGDEAQHGLPARGGAREPALLGGVPHPHGPRPACLPVDRRAPFRTDGRLDHPARRCAHREAGGLAPLRTWHPGGPVRPGRSNQESCTARYCLRWRTASG